MLPAICIATTWYYQKAPCQVTDGIGLIIRKLVHTIVNNILDLVNVKRKSILKLETHTFDVLILPKIITLRISNDSEQLSL